MDILTHREINQELCGKPLLVENGFSRVELTTNRGMAVDEHGLVHGGFVFGLADHAAMIAVNHPNVVLGAAEIKFLKPVRVNQVVTAEGTVKHREGKKQVVSVVAKCDDRVVFEGEFICFVLDKHVLG